MIQTNTNMIDCVFAAESRRPVQDCFLAVLSSHGEEGCVFGADGKPVLLSHIFRYFDNECMERRAKLFLVQVSSRMQRVHLMSSVDDRTGLFCCKYRRCVSVSAGLSGGRAGRWRGGGFTHGWRGDQLPPGPLCSCRHDCDVRHSAR